MANSADDKAPIPNTLRDATTGAYASVNASGALGIAAFTPVGNGSLLSVTTTSARVGFNIDLLGTHARVFNAGAATAFVTFGDSSVVATVVTGDKNGNGIPIPSGAVEIIATTALYVAAITGTSTATLYVTPGTGI